MHLIGAILIGFVIGLVARFLMPGRDSMGFILTTVLGVIGSLAATYIGRGLGWYGVDEPAGFLASIVGAVVVLGIYNAVSGRKRTGTILSDRDRRAA